MKVKVSAGTPTGVNTISLSLNIVMSSDGVIQDPITGPIVDVIRRARIMVEELSKREVTDIVITPNHDTTLNLALQRFGETLLVLRDIPEYREKYKVGEVTVDGDAIELIPYAHIGYIELAILRFIGRQGGSVRGGDIWNYTQRVYPRLNRTNVYIRIGRLIDQSLIRTIPVDNESRIVRYIYKLTKRGWLLA